MKMKSYKILRYIPRVKELNLNVEPLLIPLNYVKLNIRNNRTPIVLESVFSLLKEDQVQTFFSYFSKNAGIIIIWQSD